MSTALSPGSGQAPVAGARLPHADAARLLRLAALAGVRKSVILRQAVALGLDQLERDTGPPGRRRPAAERVSAETDDR
jgi:hypothetical protein